MDDEYMNNDLEKKVQHALIGIMSDGFNRSISALEKCGAINTQKMHEGYKGVGSKYYDIVTEKLEYTARYAAPYIIELVLSELKKSEIN